MKFYPLRLFFVLNAALLFTACGQMIHTAPETSPAAAAAIDRLLLMNQGIVDLKGIGRIKLILSHETQIARLAWAGTHPDKLRMDFMGAPGVVLATLASDGQWVYLRLDQEGRFYKKKSGHAIFRGMVDIPLGVQETIQILSGKIPLTPHKSSVLKQISKTRHILELKDGWGNICQKVYIDSKTNQPVSFEMVRPDGSISYRAEFQKMMDIKQYKVPKYLILSNSKGERFEMRVEKFWINQPLPSSRYSLQPHG